MRFAPPPMTSVDPDVRFAFERLYEQLNEAVPNLEANVAVLQANVLRGAGTPEGAVAADVGTIYERTDGGAGTSVYVKESGSGNTGWVGK